MMLRDRLSRLEHLAGQLKDLSLQEIETSSLIERAGRVQRWKGTLLQLHQQLQGFKALNIPLPDSPQKMTLKLQNTLKSLDDHVTYQQVKDATSGDAQVLLNQLQDRLESSMRQAWHQHMQEHTLQVDDGVLEVLSGTPGAAHHAEDIRRIRNGLGTALKKVPESREKILEVQVRQRQLRQHWQALTQGGLSPEVLHFLQQVTRPGGVDLLALTPEVLVWLSSHQLLEQFRVLPARGHTP